LMFFLAGFGQSFLTGILANIGQSRPITIDCNY
jgi:hypothetical protein